MKCKDCKYVQPAHDYGCCNLTRRLVDMEKEHDCICYNKDLSEYSICYNCKYYGGGGDWGLFCSHQDMYHHLGKFNDEPCEHYIKGEGL